VRYEQFRDRLEHSLREAGIPVSHLARNETIGLAAPSRVYELIVGMEARQSAHPFHVTARLAFCWDPIQAARSYTTEEDLLTELFGRKRQVSETATRWQRLDITFRAKLPWGSRFVAPPDRAWRDWRTLVRDMLVDLVPTEAGEDEEGRPIAAGWRGEIEVQQTCSPDGNLLFDGLEVATWQAVNLPRATDDRQERDDDLSRQMDQLSRRFGVAFTRWMDRVAELAQHLDCSGLETDS
jgi:hypothetical protein